MTTREWQKVGATDAGPPVKEWRIVRYSFCDGTEVVARGYGPLPQMAVASPYDIECTREGEDG